jgi:broad specificity phosphatase PhoE
MYREHMLADRERMMRGRSCMLPELIEVKSICRVVVRQGARGGMRYRSRLSFLLLVGLAASACASGSSSAGQRAGDPGAAQRVVAEAPRTDSTAALDLIPAFPGRGRQSTTTVIVVRHAEKATGQGDDPHLSDAGEVRARSLARSLEGAGVSAVITTQWARTAETALPTARAAGVTPEVVPVVWDSIPRHAAAIAAAVRGHPGEVILVVGHSNTVPDIVAALGVERPAAICDSEYDRMEIVSIEADGDARLIESRYGAASPRDAGCATMR